MFQFFSSADPNPKSAAPNTEEVPKTNSSEHAADSITNDTKENEKKGHGLKIKNDDNKPQTEEKKPGCTKGKHFLSKKMSKKCLTFF